MFNRKKKRRQFAEDHIINETNQFQFKKFFANPKPDMYTHVWVLSVVENRTLVVKDLFLSYEEAKKERDRQEPLMGKALELHSMRLTYAMDVRKGNTVTMTVDTQVNWGSL